MKPKRTTTTSRKSDIPYDSRDRKQTLAFWDEATPHKGVKELRALGSDWQGRQIFAEERHMKMNLIPILPVKDIGQSVAFYEKLGFRIEQRRDDWGWAMLGFGDCKIMIDRSINTQADNQRDAVLYLYPENIRKYHIDVRRTGLSIPDLDVTFYGLTEFRLTDPDGNRLWIGQKDNSDDSAA